MEAKSNTKRESHKAVVFFAENVFFVAAAMFLSGGIYGAVMGNWIALWVLGAFSLYFSSIGIALKFIK